MCYRHGTTCDWISAKKVELQRKQRRAESCTGVGKQVRIGLKENKEPGEDFYSEGGECAGKKMQ